MFWPSRRSILYFASWRLVIRVLAVLRKMAEDRALLLPLRRHHVPFAGLRSGGTDRFEAEAPAQTAGRETRRGPLRPAQCRVNRGKARSCQTFGPGFRPALARGEMLLPHAAQRRDRKQRGQRIEERHDD